MPYACPNKDQFDLDGDKITHVPTGAYWVTYPDAAEPHVKNPGRLGEKLENGDDYYPPEVEALALELLAKRL